MFISSFLVCRPRKPGGSAQRIRKVFSTIVLLVIVGTCALRAGSLDDNNSPGERSPAIKAGEVLAIMERVADWQLVHPSAHRLTDWTQGAGDAGFMALTRISASSRFRDAMMQVGEQMEWRLGPRKYHADDHCIGQTYLELYLQERDPHMLEALRKEFDDILEHPAPPAAYPRDLTWWWCDALFMGPPTWVRLFAATGERKYLDYMNTNWWATSDRLYDPEERLYFRDARYFDQREANGRKIFWSRGNGWVMAGVARVLPYLPLDFPDRERFVRQFQEMAPRVLACQQADGLWRASLLDPEHYPLKETSGSGFFTFALAWGVNEGLLDRAIYESAILRAWKALIECVDADGKLTHVQPIGADPKAFAPDAGEVYGVGAFLLAGSEVYRLCDR